MPEFEAVIGLETHIQLNSVTKIFCSCSADSWGQPPNTNICPVCTGMPGVLPVLNRSVVEKAVVLAQAMHAQINAESFFDRKNYFYPDLPKGYQISQYDQPLATGGYMDLPLPGGALRSIGIHKLHIEEDAGKTRNEAGVRLIDFNRCGVPLVEMVTDPDLRSADEAAEYLIRLRQLLRWLGVSDADMEKAQLRCDANVSIRPLGAGYLNPKTEIKNVNSIEAVRHAITHEIQRQIRETEAGRPVEPWTLDWDDETQTISKMRSKETEADYRYFREPDLLPIIIDDPWKADILRGFPELPLEVKSRFMVQYELPEYDAEILTTDYALAEYFQSAVRAYRGEAKRVSNWLMNDVLRMVNERGLSISLMALTPTRLASILRMLDKGRINAGIGKSLLQMVEDQNLDPETIVEIEGLGLVSDDNPIRAAAQSILAANPKEVAAYQAGKAALLGWFVGQVMRELRGKADANKVRSILEELLRG